MMFTIQQSRSFRIRPQSGANIPQLFLFREAMCA